MKISLFIPLLLTIAVMSIVSAGCGDPPGLDDAAIRADSIRHADSLHRLDSLHRGDSLNTTDSLRRADSLHQADSLRRADSLHQADSLRRADSLHQADSLRRADSVRMSPDQGIRDVLCDLAANVYTAATADIATRVTDVTGAIADLRTTRTADNLERARRLWKLARRPWEFFEVGLLGPAKNQQTDPEINSWPADINTIRSILDGRDRIDVTSLAREEGTAKGFHAIEYLLWGPDGKQVVEHITDREFDYMVAAATLMQSSVTRLNATWQGTRAGDSAAYRWQFCHAGQPGSLYTSALAALRESINSSSSLASELQNSKLGIPYHSPDNSFEESRFSNTSKEDFIANLDGIKAWYTGEYRERSVPITGLGISSLVVKKNPDLDARVRAAIDEAMWRVMAIQPSFGEAINSGNKGTIAGAITAVQRLEAILENEVLPLFK